jgi:hypothetical protein
MNVEMGTVDSDDIYERTAFNRQKTTGMAFEIQQFIPSSGETCPTLAGGSRIDIRHKYYVALHTNLLVIYII